MFANSTRFAGQPAAAFKMGLACAVTLLLAGATAHANGINLVQNGDFSSNSGAFQLGYQSHNVTDWSMSSAHLPGYTFLFNAATADTTGSVGQYGGLSLWGPAHGSANGLTASPDGGAFLAMDSDFQMDAVQQTINGLTAGDNYTVGFWWAAAQQYTFNGSTYDTFQVSLGGATQTTPELDISSHGFSGWQHQTFTFQATQSSEVLSFLAVGGPKPFTTNSVPPFALLDGVTLNADTSPVPESPSAYLLMTGCICLGAIALYRRRQVTANQAA